MQETKPLPAPWRRTLELSSGKAEVRVSYGPDTVDMKVYVRVQEQFGFYHFIPFKAAGKHQIVKYPVAAITMRLKLADGTVLKARSCCKPPDEFDEGVGLKLVVRRLIRLNSDYIKQSSDRRDEIFPGPQIVQDTALLQVLNPNRS